MQDLLINLLASIIAGVAVWLAQRVLRFRRINIRRAFLGLKPGAEALLFVSKHSSSPSEKSVHRDDVAALLELAAMIKELDGQPVLLAHGENTSHRNGPEFCVGGPYANPRVAAYLRADLPGIAFGRSEPGAEALPLGFQIGEQVFPHRKGQEEYAVLARLSADRGGRAPAFLLMGQRAAANVAAAQYLAANARKLSRSHPAGTDFCLVLRLREPEAFGSTRVELVGDLIEAARRPQPGADAAEQPEG